MILADNAPGVNPNLSADQRTAVDLIIRSYARKPGKFALGGLAGTGKTTVLTAAIPRFAEMGLQVAVACPTNKAALVLRGKGITDATTLHKLLYKSVPVKRWSAKRNDYITTHYESTPYPVGSLAFDVVIVDEASMVREEEFQALKAHNIHIILCGDYGQLPPVNSFNNLLSDENRDFTLTTIHRQASNSAILDAAYKVRSGLSLTSDDNSPGQVTVASSGQADLFNCDIVIVYKNETRIKLNTMRRAADKRASRLEVGESVICCQNDHKTGVVNGQTFKVSGIIDNQTDVCKVRLTDDLGDTIMVQMWMGGFNNPDSNVWAPKGSVRFDYAYAITCHKAQGSEWDSVAVVEQGYYVDNCWRYTAITRAAKRLVYVQL